MSDETPPRPKGPDYYNPNTGKLSRRESKAQKQLEAMTIQYQAQGMSEADARERARKEMRDNARADWRAG
jgi:hypothetical protein